MHGRDVAPVETSRFAYHLPRELIARYPVPRGTARLLIVDRSSGKLLHKKFGDVLTFLHPGDVLVLNDTRVIPARFLGRKESGGSVEVFLLRRLEADRWVCLVKASKKLKPGMRVHFGQDLTACIGERVGDGCIVIFSDPDRVPGLGKMPLPPYLEREAEDSDNEDYQTVYARHDGSVAAPTAGLHFTRGMLGEIVSMGVQVVPLTLHVGQGTFTPVRAEQVEDHLMHSEEYTVSEEAAGAIHNAMEQGRRIVAVGTTSARVLEHVIREAGRIVAGSGSTDIFIYDGFPFRAVNALLTNFHLPCSTLLMLVSAFTGHELIMKAYEEAIRNRYRFFSYGDAMLIV
ncbi:MAG TPA: tRNA preQ1(34) S-adenosylmethionine ribosyltransferase-isomerase QueA [Deltaproteobacteria bacterium]|nr:tRNA preQ1(34) S-adenosylmethionine ribosyltransferase-isomerase QueA [Deltaproteobacteria bacterium]HPR55286.1 tRNA preQ1(34) S-adenosylmethionine ribosyltransferase-isomerase QueA [Deltaproteobacteria bacterium]HXK46923.1 tRNA preQ1(34) S-adenosylmethionine ribosyltransferase-isomerase QueA [Deltaproteobacteria bacterium]